MSDASDLGLDLDELRPTTRLQLLATPLLVPPAKVLRSLRRCTTAAWSRGMNALA